MPSSLHVVPATPAQQIDRDRLTYLEWGKPLTEAQYLERQQVLRGTPWAIANQKTWLLVDANGAILSSCDIFKMESSLGGKKGISFGIANVVTGKSLRGKGYAQKLLEGVIAELRNVEPKALSFHLLSEVGESLYNRAGFQRVFTEDVRYPSAGAGVSKDARPLERSDLSALLAVRKSPSPHLQFLPTAEQFGWHYARQDFYAEKLGVKNALQAGVRVGDAYMIWALDFKYKKLRVLQVAATSQAEVEQLIDAARHFAHQQGMPEVRIWKNEIPPGLSFPNSPEIGESDDGIFMICPANPSDYSAPKTVCRAVWI